MFMSLYADKTKGILTEQRFFRMTETLEQEQADNKARMQAITDELRSVSDTEDDVRRFIGEIREYASITELDETILNRLIDKIIISAVEVINGEKVQKVRIIYNFIGEITWLQPKNSDVFLEKLSFWLATIYEKIYAIMTTEIG